MYRAVCISAAVLVACGGAGHSQSPDGGSPPPGDGGVGYLGPPGSDGGPTQPDDSQGPTLPLRHSPIDDENQLPGDSGWHLSAPSKLIAAYADRTSALPGETVQIHAGVVAAAASPARWQLWRLGYYGGQGGRTLAEGGPVQVPPQTAAILDPATGAVSANWAASFSVAVPRNAITGAYLVKITSDLGETYATFVVREPARAGVILYAMSTNTYQAYNPWGGTSLYDNFRTDWQQWHAYAVSFDRPYDQDFGAGELFSKDRDFITFAESQGYDIAYISDSDLDRDPKLVARRRMILFQGHSEYWTGGMRDAAEAAIAAGINEAFLGANNAYWQVRWANGSRRMLIGYKEFASLDPANATDPAHVTTRFRDRPLRRPESAMIGAQYGLWMLTASPMTVTDASSWLWAGSGVTQGAVIAGVYGDECDERDSDSPFGTAAIADASADSYTGQLDQGETTIYTAHSGAQVFGAGSILFSHALAGSERWDRRIQQLVANLFSRFAGDGTVPAPLQHLDLPAGLPAPSYRPGVTVSTITRNLQQPVAVAAASDGSAVVIDDDAVVSVSPAGVVTRIAGGPPGLNDGPAAQALFRNPRGVALGRDGTIYVADAFNNRIRAISGGMVRTVAGSRQGFADGKGDQAMFSQPMGLALTAAGTLLVADMWNHRLREVTPDGTVTTWTGTGSAGFSSGPAATATLYYPFGVATTSGGDALLLEPGTGLLRAVSGKAPHDVSAIAGALGSAGWTDGPAWSAGVSETVAIAVRADGQIVLLDGASARVRALKGGVIDTVAGGSRGGTVDGPGEAAGFGWPRGVAVAADGSLLVVDLKEHALRRIVLPP